MTDGQEPNEQSEPNKEMAKPLLFISHKHLDRELADVVRGFVTRSTAGRVRVFQSSDPGAEGPMIGQPLTDEVGNALDEAQVVLLAYTSGEHNWDYCMWECGVATNPAGDSTRLVVLECADDSPRTFSDKLRIQAVDADQIKKLTIQLLTGDQFFAGHGPVTDFNPEGEDIAKLAEGFYEDLRDKLPDNGKPTKWPIWPTLTLEMNSDVVGELEAASGDERRDVAMRWIRENATVINATSGASSLFGKAQLRDGTSISAILEWWTSEYPGTEPEWLETLAEQLTIGALEQNSRPIVWKPLREINGLGRFLAGAGSLRGSPGGGTVRLSFHFYARPGAQLVKSHMTKLKKIRRIDLGQDDPAQVNLVATLEELEDKGWNRLPVVGPADQAMFIIHTSMIDRFLRQKALSDSGASLDVLTMADLLADDEMKEMFQSTFVVVPEAADLTQATAAMEAVANCQDVFVTETGEAEEPVLGWLTNLEIIEALRIAST